MPDNPDEARRKVLEKWPEAMAFGCPGRWKVICGRKAETVGAGETKAAAWLSAAKKLGDGK